MNILQIQNHQNITNTKVNKQTNPSFGVKLVASEDIPKFVVKQAMNVALREGKNPHAMADMFYSSLQTQFKRLVNSVDEFEPRNLEVRLDLNNRAKRYANDLNVNGDIFTGTPAQVSAKKSFFKQESLPVEDLTPSPNVFYNIKFVIKKLADMVR